MIVATALLAVACAAPALAQGVSQLNGKLFTAIRANDMAGVNSALTAGADPNAVNSDGQTAAGLAVDLGNFQIAHYILAVRNQRQEARKDAIENDPRLAAATAAPATPAAAGPFAVAPAIDRTQPEPNWRTGATPGQPAEIPTARITSPRDAVMVVPSAPQKAPAKAEAKAPTQPAKTAAKAPAKAAPTVAAATPSAVQPALPPAPPPLPAGTPNPFDPGVPVLNAPPVLATPAAAAPAANLIDPGAVKPSGGIGKFFGGITDLFSSSSSDAGKARPETAPPPASESAKPSAANTAAEPTRVAAVAPAPIPTPAAVNPAVKANVLPTPRATAPPPAVKFEPTPTPPPLPPSHAPAPLPAIKAAPKRDTIAAESLPPPEPPAPPALVTAEPVSTPMVETAAAPAETKSAQPDVPHFFTGLQRIFGGGPSAAKDPAPVEAKAEVVAAAESEKKPGFFTRMFRSTPAEPAPAAAEPKSLEPAPPPPAAASPETKIETKIETPRALTPKAEAVAAAQPTPPPPTIVVPALSIEPPPAVKSAEPKTGSVAQAEPQQKPGGFFGNLFNRPDAAKPTQVASLEPTPQPFDAKTSAPAELPTVEDKSLGATPTAAATAKEPVQATREESGVGHFFRSMFAKAEPPKAAEPTPIPPGKLVEAPVIAAPAPVPAAVAAPVRTPAPEPLAAPTPSPAPVTAATQVAAVAPRAEPTRPPASRLAPAAPAGDAFVIGTNMSLERPFKEPAPGDTNCFRKGKQPGWYCLETTEWAPEIGPKMEVDSWLYAHARTIVHYDGGKVQSIYTVFPADNFNAVLRYFEDRFGPAQLETERFVPLVGEPAKMNATATWTRRNKADGNSTMELRKYDNVRGMIPDAKVGFLRLTRDGATPIFRYVTESDLMLQSLKMQDGNKLR